MSPALSSLSLAQRRKLAEYISAWLAKCFPGHSRRILMPAGTVQVRDGFGWRDAGTLLDFLAVARALGRLS